MTNALKYITVAEAAEKAGASKNTIKYWAATGVVRARKDKYGYYEVVEKDILETAAQRQADPKGILKRRRKGSVKKAFGGYTHSGSGRRGKPAAQDADDQAAGGNNSNIQ